MLTPVILRKRLQASCSKLESLKMLKTLVKRRKKVITVLFSSFLVRESSTNNVQPIFVPEFSNTDAPAECGVANIVIMRADVSILSPLSE